MKKTIIFFILSLIITSVSYGQAQENPYAVQTNVIKNEQAIANLRQQQANLYLKIEDLLVKYGELKGRLDDVVRRLEAIETRLSVNMQKPIPNANNEIKKNAIEKQPQKIAKEPALEPNLKNKESIKKEPPKAEQQTQASKAQNSIQEQQKENIKKQPSKSDKEVFGSAKSLYDKKLYTDAIKAFTSFKEQYKDSILIPDAIFYIAESYFNKKVYDKAIINYDYLINTYPKSNFVPNAILKEGISFINLGDGIDGKYLLKKVIADYPNSNAAKDAKEYLLRMK